MFGRRSKKQETEPQQDRELGAQEEIANFPESSIRSNHLQTRQWEDISLSTISRVVWRKAVFDSHTRLWNVMNYIQEQINDEEHSSVQNIASNVSYQQALSFLHQFEEGHFALDDLSEDNLPENYYILVAEYDGIVFSKEGKISLALDGHVTTTGRYNKATLQRVLEKTQAVKKGAVLPLRQFTNQEKLYSSKDMLQKRLQSIIRKSLYSKPITKNNALNKNWKDLEKIWLEESSIEELIEGIKKLKKENIESRLTLCKNKRDEGYFTLKLRHYREVFFNINYFFSFGQKELKSLLGESSTEFNLFVKTYHQAHIFNLVLLGKQICIIGEKLHTSNRSAFKESFSYFMKQIETGLNIDKDEQGEDIKESDHITLTLKDLGTNIDDVMAMVVDESLPESPIFFNLIETLYEEKLNFLKRRKNDILEKRTDFSKTDQDIQINNEMIYPVKVFVIENLDNAEEERVAWIRAERYEENEADETGNKKGLSLVPLGNEKENKEHWRIVRFICDLSETKNIEIYQVKKEENSKEILPRVESYETEIVFDNQEDAAEFVHNYRYGHLLEERGSEDIVLNEKTFDAFLSRIQYHIREKTETSK